MLLVFDPQLSSLCATVIVVTACHPLSNTCCSMAAVAQKKWLRQMRSSIQVMTEILIGISAADSPSTSPQAHIPGLHCLQVSLRNVKTRGYQQVEAALMTRPEHALFVADVVLLLNTLVPQLSRFGLDLSLTGTSGNASIEKEHFFWELWQILTVACEALQSAFERWPGLWPATEQLANESLHAASAGIGWDHVNPVANQYLKAFDVLSP